MLRLFLLNVRDSFSFMLVWNLIRGSDKSDHVIVQSQSLRFMILCLLLNNSTDKWSERINRLRHKAGDSLNSPKISANVIVSVANGSWFTNLKNPLTESARVASGWCLWKPYDAYSKNSVWKWGELKKSRNNSSIVRVGKVFSMNEIHDFCMTLIVDSVTACRMSGQMKNWCPKRWL